jgi:hypothetical protein
MRGPVTLPGPLTPRGTKERPTRREAFDLLVVGHAERLRRRWPTELAGVDVGTEDVPSVPPEWGGEPAPFGLALPATPDRKARIVVFRRPVELRAKTRGELSALVYEVLVEHVAELLGRTADEIDPDR